MSHVTITWGNTAARPLPALGHGLWVDHLDAPQACETLVGELAGAHLDLLVDMRKPDSARRLQQALALCERTATPAWLLVVVSDEQPARELERLAQVLASAGAAPQGVLVTPAAYLLSYQPDATWPPGPSPMAIAALARQYLPSTLIGGGVPTYFTELNRCRPAAGSFDYLTHATSPVVHAADDRSVMESLQALGDIVRSARQLAHGRPYRLTTSAIGAWCNPYGGRLTANPARQRLTLSDQDPRQRGLFAAAWTLGHYAALCRAAVDAVALWAVNEPFAAAGAGEYWPVFHVLRGLNRGRGRHWVDLQVSNEAVAVLAWRDGAQVQVWLANLTGHEQPLGLPAWRVLGQAGLDAGQMLDALDCPHWLDRRRAGSDGLDSLPAYAVRVLDCLPDIECGG